MKTSLAKQWLLGADIQGFNELTLNKKQREFVNAKDRYNLVSGGMASGKTLGFVVKFLILAQYFEGSQHLIGRKTKTNAAETFMKDFREVCPPDLYEYQIGAGKILFKNGSEATFFGLDALQSGSEDTKKAEQTLKSHNFHFAWLDQLEEIEEKVFNALDARIRGRMCKHHKGYSKKYKRNGITIFEECQLCGEVSFNQINSTTNPANYWGYEFFKGKPNPMSHLVETSMLDNKDYLPEATIQAQMSKPKKWVDRYVLGKWEPWSDEGALVFLSDYLVQQRTYEKKPLRSLGGIDIYAEPDDHIYQIGLDPSEGSQDPCAIVCVDTFTGELVASFTGFYPAQVQAEKATQMALMFSRVEKPLIIPESNGVGAAVIEHLKPRYDKIYLRETYNTRENRETTKVGWNTSHATKSLLIENAKSLFEKGFIKLRNRAIVDEFLQFEYTNEAQKKGAGAKNGAHDDLVMATLMAYWDVQPPTKNEGILSRKVKNNKKRINFQYV